MAERRIINPGNLVRCRYNIFQDEIGFVLRPFPIRDLDENHIRVVITSYEYVYPGDFHWFEYKEVEDLGPPTDLEKIIYGIKTLNNPTLISKISKLKGPKEKKRAGFSKFFTESIFKSLKRL